MKILHLQRSISTLTVHQGRRLAGQCWAMKGGLCGSGLGLESAELGYETVMLSGAAPGNRLRPEAVESFFYLWRATGEPEYRDWGWAVFEAFQQHSRTPQGAYASVRVSLSSTAVCRFVSWYSEPVLQSGQGVVMTATCIFTILCSAR